MKFTARRQSRDQELLGGGGGGERGGAVDKENNGGVEEVKWIEMIPMSLPHRVSC